MMTIIMDLARAKKLLCTYKVIQLSLVLISVYLSIAPLLIAWKRSSSPECYRKYDFYQFYIVARSLYTPINISLPLPVLAREVIERDSLQFQENHQNPYTASLGIVLFPLGYLTYVMATKAWLVLRLLIILFIVRSIFRNWWERNYLVTGSLGFCFIINSSAFWSDAWRGQITFFTLALFLLF
jgi:hypothetical protein